MSYRLEYIGPTQTFQASSLNPSILNLIDVHIEQGQQFVAELRQDGPMTIINGQYLIDPNTTMWVVLPSLGCQIPYSPEAILNHWKMI